MAEDHLEPVNTRIDVAAAEYAEVLGFKKHNHNDQFRVIRTLVNYGQQQGCPTEGVDFWKGFERRK